MVVAIYGTGITQDTQKITEWNVSIDLSADFKDKKDQSTKLSTSLIKLSKLFRENKDYREFANQSKLQLTDDKVVVTLLPEPGSVAESIDERYLKEAGAVVLSKSRHSMRVEIPLTSLETVAENVRGIGRIQEPLKPVEQAVTSEGVSLMRADVWQTSGRQGSGAKVAVIDGGFNGLTASQTNGDIPATYASQDFSGTGLQTGTQHGTAVAEAVYDVAPQASLYLYKIEDFTDFENAKDACIANGVHIVNHSMGWFNTGGYYDGTGYVCAVADDAHDNGILWVNSAGNSAEDHYRATFVDFGGEYPGYHKFGASANINPLGPDSTHVWVYSSGAVITVTMNWDNYPVTDQDYDLYLLKYDGSSWSGVASSVRRQNGSVSPEESITYTNPGADGMFGVIVYRYSATVDVDFTLFSLNGGFGRHTAASSLTDPATSSDVVAVGAIDRNNYVSGPQESFSSQGPTTNGTDKPDVTAPDNCNSFVYGYWNGTSLASPHTAGVCALIKSLFTGYSNDQIRNYLITSCTSDLGIAGMDSVYGWGKVVLPDVVVVTSPAGGEDWQEGTVHDITWASIGTSGTVKIEYSTNGGSGWSDVIASTADDGIHSWTIPNTPSTNCLVRISDTDGSPSGASGSVFTISTTFVLAKIKVFLEGPYQAGGNMTTALKTAGYIPATSPYADGRTVAAVPDGVTDWVSVELRSSEDGPTLIQKSFFLKSNGSVVDMDGTTTDLTLPGMAEGDYFIVVRHRNHLAVMSKSAHSLGTGAPAQYDFSSGTGQYLGDDAKLLESGVYGLYSGDADASGTVDAGDRSATWNNRNLSGYLSADCNLSGTVDAGDRSITWNNRNKSTSVH